MLSVVAISFMFYLIMTLVGNYYLASMSALFYLILIYLLPPIVNYIATKFVKSSNEKLLLSVLLPTFSTLFYGVLSWLTEQSGAWLAFVEKIQFRAKIFH